MLFELRKRLYTAEATVKGGRQGHGRTSDGVLDLDVRLPVEMGGKGGGANPEQLFAVGYGACFQSAIAEAGRRLGHNATESTVTSRVSIGLTEGGDYGLAVELVIAIPGLDHDAAVKVVHAAHSICPYSNAIRGNVDVSFVVE
ncbi:MAG TPA: organic hydroperoxide resistance protein [Vicinamibacterales bacterium]|jgi:osmotically inducible protein OsmC|nr:organic hydroperoxide resistance protein [Vicinamibacterales bacterium]